MIEIKKISNPGEECVAVVRHAPDGKAVSVTYYPTGTVFSFDTKTGINSYYANQTSIGRMGEVKR